MLLKNEKIGILLWFWNNLMTAVTISTGKPQDSAANRSVNRNTANSIKSMNRVKIEIEYIF